MMQLNNSHRTDEVPNENHDSIERLGTGCANVYFGIGLIYWMALYGTVFYKTVFSPDFGNEWFFTVIGLGIFLPISIMLSIGWPVFFFWWPLGLMEIEGL